MSQHCASACIPAYRFMALALRYFSNLPPPLFFLLNGKRNSIAFSPEEKQFRHHQYSHMKIFFLGEKAIEFHFPFEKKGGWRQVTKMSSSIGMPANPCWIDDIPLESHDVILTFHITIYCGISIILFTVLLTSDTQS